MNFRYIPADAVDQALQQPAGYDHVCVTPKTALAMLTAPFKAGRSPKATPVMIPTSTSKAPAATVERSLGSPIWAVS